MSTLTKLFIGILVLFFIIVAGSIYSLYTVESNSETLVSYIERLEDYIKNEDWDNADNELIRVNKAWEKIKTNWPIMIRHKEIDSVTICLERVKILVKMRQKILILAELAELKEHIRSIPEMEAFTIKNIL